MIVTKTNCDVCGKECKAKVFNCVVDASLPQNLTNNYGVPWKGASVRHACSAICLREVVSKWAEGEFLKSFDAVPSDVPQSTEEVS